MRHEVKSRLESMDVESAEQIRRNLLDEIQNNSEFTSPQVAASLRRLIDDVVRPLSRYFEQQTDGWMPPDPPKQLLQIDWRNAALNSFNSKYIQPFLLIALMLWISLTNTILHRGLVVGLMAIVHGMVFAIPLFILIRNRAIQLSRSQNRLKQGLIFFASLYIGGQIFGLTTWVYAGWEQPFYYYSKMGPFYVIAGGSLIAFAQSVIEESRSIEAVLIQSGEDLRWSLARSRESHRQQRRALAHALHGQIQAALASAVLRLEISAHSSEQDSKIVESIVDSLKASILNVQLLDAKSETLDVVLDRIRDTWSGIAKIEAHIEPGVLELLHADQTCAVALNDVLTELTYNSIKHGSASAIEIHLSLKDSRSLTVLVSDNGSAPTNSASRGLGSALLDDCAISWNRIRKADRTMSEVLLPLEVAEPISV